MKKATRRSSAGLEIEQTSVANFRTRFSLSSFVKRVEKLTYDQRTLITRMGFGNLLLIPNLTLSKTLLVELMDRWDCERHAFILCPGEITITPMDVALILGLRVVGDPVVLKDDEPFSDLEKEYGAAIWKRKITIASIESRLESLGGVVNDDFVRSFLLFIFGTFLFPNANGKVDSRFLSLLKDLDNVYQYAWGVAVVDDLFNWLCKRKEMNVQYVGGCLILLQIWCFEHIDISRPSLADCNLMYPRACRWGNVRSLQRQWLSSKFKELQENQIIWKLLVTSEELKTDVIKDLMEATNCEGLLIAQHSSTNGLYDDDVTSFVQQKNDLTIKSQIISLPVVELESETESESAKVHGLPEDNLGQLTELQNLSVVLTSDVEHSSTLCCISEEGDLRRKNQMLEEQNMDLKEVIDKLRIENEQLRNQLSSISMFIEQNAEMTKKVENLRIENQLLRSSSDGLVTRLEKLLLENLNATEETQRTTITISENENCL